MISRYTTMMHTENISSGEFGFEVSTCYQGSFFMWFQGIPQWCIQKISRLVNLKFQHATKGHFWCDFKVPFYLQLSHNGAFRHDLFRWMHKIPISDKNQLLSGNVFPFSCTCLGISLGISLDIHQTRSYQYAPLFNSHDEI